MQVWFRLFCTILIFNFNLKLNGFSFNLAAKNFSKPFLLHVFPRLQFRLALWFIDWTTQAVWWLVLVLAIIKKRFQRSKVLTQERKYHYSRCWCSSGLYIPFYAHFGVKIDGNLAEFQFSRRSLLSYFFVVILIYLYPSWWVFHHFYSTQCDTSPLFAANQIVPDSSG